MQNFCKRQNGENGILQNFCKPYMMFWDCPDKTK